MTQPHNASCLKNKFGKRYVFRKDLKTVQLERRVHTKRDKNAARIHTKSIYLVIGR